MCASIMVGFVGEQTDILTAGGHIFPPQAMVIVVLGIIIVIMIIIIIVIMLLDYGYICPPFSGNRMSKSPPAA